MLANPKPTMAIAACGEPGPLQCPRVLSFDPENMRGIQGHVAMPERLSAAQQDDCKCPDLYDRTHSERMIMLRHRLGKLTRKPAAEHQQVIEAICDSTGRKTGRLPAKHRDRASKDLIGILSRCQIAN